MLINENRIGQSNGFVFLFIAIITLSNTSQMPYFIKSGIGRHLTMSIWILALICIILSGLLLLSEKMIFLIIMAMFFTIILLVGEIISPGMYLHSSLVYPFFSSLFIFIIGFFASKKITKNDFKYIIGSYVISTVIVSLSVYFKSFSSGFSWESRVYNYGAKNIDRVKKTFKLTFIMCFAYTVFMWGALMLAPEVLVGIFNNDPALVEITSWSIKIYFAGMFMFGIQTACQQTFLALGEAKISLLLALLRKIVLLIPLIFILPIFMEDKLFAVFLAEPIADITAALTTILCFTIFYKKTLSVIGKKSESNVKENTVRTN